jgi:phage tail P2-like protein
MPEQLLPPNATPLERALADATARLGDIAFDIEALWNPATCPIALLPWLAWSLSTDSWDPEWTEARKREAVAGAIGAQRIKGSRAAVEAVLARFDALLTLVEWFEATPRLDPHTFEVRLQLVGANGVAGGTHASAATARAIVAEISRAKPARAHFRLIQELTLEACLGIVAVATATNYRRLDLEVLSTADIDWSDMLQDQNGEPLEDDTGELIDGSAA